MAFTSSTPPTVLSIAGSDPSGGAGIQADLKTFAALACYGTSAITALTAQNTVGVLGVHACPPSFVELQASRDLNFIASVLDDLEVHAIKTGMLCNLENTKAVVRVLTAHYKGSTMPPLVCDPVCVSTSGHTLLEDNSIKAMIEELFPLATLITPNKSEAELLLSYKNVSRKINSVEDMIFAAKELLSYGSSAVFVKGGHLTASTKDVEDISSRHPAVPVVRYGLMEDNMEILQTDAETTVFELVVDILQQTNGTTTMFIRPRIDSRNTHGTGCTLSSAIACALARGTGLVEACRYGSAYTHLGIETAYGLGKGHGPLNHLHSTLLLSIPKRTPSNPYPFTRLLIQSTAKPWKEYVEHSFVRQLGMGTLSRKAFEYFIKQDYHYLKYYARAYGLLATKSTQFPSIESSAQTILYILREIGTHKTYCLTFGITEEDLESTPETSATMAYGAYLIDIGVRGDSTVLLVALLACLLGYGEVGLWLKKQAAAPNSWVKVVDNPYQKWMDDYSGADYQNAVHLGLEVIESRALADAPSPARLGEWCGVWERCTRLEKAFWDSAMAEA
ncbi:Ribokinase-like protein [Crucibulum laeve]|uniref:Ribokinase-like protein n=1 Tax=Crucibulum laeve TaxID=68775 RepID=A0A5C3LIS8_9AGAR|nr:Ribokinase-like protein [Crucibulum laeve]